MSINVCTRSYTIKYKWKCTVGRAWSSYDIIEWFVNIWQKCGWTPASDSRADVYIWNPCWPLKVWSSELTFPFNVELARKHGTQRNKYSVICLFENHWKTSLINQVSGDTSQCQSSDDLNFIRLPRTHSAYRLMKKQTEMYKKSFLCEVYK